MNRPSITSAESFLERAQRSEARRVALWIAVLLAMTALAAARPLKRDVVMSDDEVFYPYLAVLAAAAIVQAVLLAALWRADRRKRLLPDWLWRSAAAFDLAVVLLLLAIAAFWSPRGPIPALSAPPLLLLPLVVLLSILRLRPVFTLGVGLAGAAAHVLLSLRAVRVTESTPEAFPVYLSYGVIIALTGLAGMFVAGQVRAHVREAADEAAAHERAERNVADMERDLSVASDIQRGLLPTRPPSLAGFDITGMNRPADQTGGDYYDWQSLPDGRLAVAIADVTGHGIGPALVRAVCRACARASTSASPDPAALVTRLNDLLHGDLPGDRFITFVVAVLDEGGGAQLVSAGHGPTLLYRAATGEITQFGGDGIPLGINPGEEYEPATSMSLDKGDVLPMLTDGFFESVRPAGGEGFGIPRLRDALRAAAPVDAQGILRSIDQAVKVFCQGAPQSGDMTAIVIKRTSPASPRSEGKAVASSARIQELSRP